MSDVEQLWFWLEERGTAPVSSVRDFIRRDRWAASQEAFARNHLREGSSTFSFNPTFNPERASPTGIVTLDYSVDYRVAA